MGNLFTTESNIESNNDYMIDLRKWENGIKDDNLKRNYKTNNGPNYIKNLKSWSDNIKMNNFIRSSDTNNPPDYVKELKLKNQYLEDELGKLDNDFKKISIK